MVHSLVLHDPPHTGSDLERSTVIEAVRVVRVIGYHKPVVHEEFFIGLAIVGENLTGSRDRRGIHGCHTWIRPRYWS
jgi:hypothetical protein